MDPMTIAYAVSAVGSIFGGIGARQQAKLDAYNIQSDRKFNQASAMQQAQARREEYDIATSSNIAAFAAQGRDIGSDQSVKAFLERQQEIVGQDLGRIQNQSRMEDLNSMQQAAATRRQGQQAFIGSLFNAAESAYKARSAYQDVKTPQNMNTKNTMKIRT